MQSQEKTVKALKHQIKGSLLSIKSDYQAFKSAPPAQKIVLATQVRQSLNTSDSHLKNLEFEVNMLPIASRETYKETLKSLRTQHNDCRRYFFLMEDEVGHKVLQLAQDTQKQDDSEYGVRQRNLTGFEGIQEAERKIYALNQKAENTATLMRDANRNLYYDKRLIEKIVDDEGKLRADIEIATQRVVEIEKMVFYRKYFLAAGVLQITFPTGINLSQSPSLTCAPIYGLTGNSITCTKQSNTVLRITGVFPNTDKFVIFEVSNMKNPGSVSFFYPQLSQFDSSASSTSTDSSGPNTFKFLTTPGSLTFGISQTTSSVAGALTNVDLTFKVSNNLESNGLIQISLPKWNAGTTQIDRVESYIDFSSIAYSNTENGYVLTCSSPSHASIKCVLQVTTIFTDSLTAVDFLKISGFSSTITPTTTLTVSIGATKFKNPPSTKPVTSFSVATYNNNFQMIDQQASGITYKATSAATLDSSKVQIIPQNKQISFQTSYDFIINMPLPMAIGTSLLIKIPSSVRISENSVLVLSTALGYSPIYPLLQVQVVSSSSQIVKISNMINTNQNYVDRDTIIKFTLLELVNPVSTSTVNSFEISFFDQEYEYLKSTSSAITQPIQSGILNNPSIVPTSFRTNEQTTYTFSFTPTNKIIVGGGVSVTLPADYTLGSTSAFSYTGVTGILSTGTLAVNQATRKITITNAFSATSSPVTITFQITKGIYNPVTTKTTGTFTLSTVDQTGGVIDSDSTLTITPSVNELANVTVMECSNNNYPSTVNDLCTYTLYLNLSQKYPILVGSWIQITFPSELTIPNYDQSRAATTTNGIQDSLSTFTYSSTSPSVLEIRNGFTAPVTNPTQTQYVLDYLKVNIGLVKSPSTTAPTSSFQVKIFDSTNNIQYQKITGIIAQVEYGLNFTSYSVSRNNEANGAEGVTYTFSIKLPSNAQVNHYIKVIPPSSIEIRTVKDQCVGTSPLQTLLACKMSNGALYIPIVTTDSQITSISSSTTLQFSIKGIVNPISIEDSGSFQLYITSSTLQDYYSNQMITGLSVENTQTGTLNDIRIIPDSNQLGATTNYDVYFTIQNSVPLGGYVDIYFPYSLYGAISTYQCQAIKNLDSGLYCKLDFSTRNTLMLINSINTTEINKGQEIAFKIVGVNNPSVASTLASERFKIRTVSPSGFTIDESQNLNFTFGCQYPCLSCSGGFEKCISCQQPNPLLPFYVSDFTCTTDCPKGTFPNNQLQCQKCSFPCQSCSEDSLFCTECQAGSALPYVKDDEGKCYDNCPYGTFAKSSTLSCEDCPFPCQHCDTAQSCLVCADSFYFFQQQCFSSCPNTSVPINSSEIKECQQCKAPCYTCSGDVSNCTSCQIKPDIFYLYGNQCIEQCPKQYLPNQNNECVKMTEKTAPFISFIFTGLTIIIVFVSNKIYPRTRFFTSVLAIQSLLMVPLWIYLLAFLIKDQHKSSSALIVFALLSNAVLNVLWYLYYKKKVVPLDESYQLYMAHYPRVSKMCVIMSLIGTFQFFRLQYSRMFGSRYLNCTFQLKEKYYQKLNRYSLLQITFVYLPVISSNIYNLVWTWYGRQVFWIDIECLITSLFMLACHTVVILRSEYLYAQDKYQFQISANTTNKDASILDTKLGEGTNRSLLLKSLQGSQMQRQQVLQSIIKQVKQNKEAIEVLGVSIDFKDKKALMEEYDIAILDSERKQLGIDKAYQSENYTGRNIKVPYIDEINEKMQEQSVKRQQKYLMDFQELNQHNSRDDLTPSHLISEFDYISAPITAEKSLTKNAQLHERYEAFQKELKQKYGQDNQQNPTKRNLNDQYTTLGAPRSQTQVNQFDGEDIDDEEGGIQAQIHGDNQIKAGNSAFKRPQSSQLLEEIKGQIEQVEKQGKKFHEKAKSINMGSKHLNQQIDSERQKQLSLQKLIQSLKQEYQDAQSLYEQAQRYREEQLKFIEDANYTSEEDQMGVSPSAFNIQNQRFLNSSDRKKKKQLKRKRTLEEEKQDLSNSQAQMSFQEQKTQFFNQQQQHLLAELGNTGRKKSRVIPLTNLQESTLQEISDQLINSSLSQTQQDIQMLDGKQNKQFQEGLRLQNQRQVPNSELKDQDNSQFEGFVNEELGMGQQSMNQNAQMDINNNGMGQDLTDKRGYQYKQNQDYAGENNMNINEQFLGTQEQEGTEELSEEIDIDDMHDHRIDNPFEENKLEDDLINQVELSQRKIKKKGKKSKSKSRDRSKGRPPTQQKSKGILNNQGKLPILLSNQSSATKDLRKDLEQMRIGIAKTSQNKRKSKQAWEQIENLPLEEQVQLMTNLFHQKKESVAMSDRKERMKSEQTRGREKQQKRKQTVILSGFQSSQKAGETNQLTNRSKGEINNARLTNQFSSRGDRIDNTNQMSNRSKGRNQKDVGVKKGLGKLKMGSREASRKSETSSREGRERQLRSNQFFLKREDSNLIQESQELSSHDDISPNANTIKKRKKMRKSQSSEMQQYKLQEYYNQKLNQNLENEEEDELEDEIDFSEIEEQAKSIIQNIQDDLQKGSAKKSLKQYIKDMDLKGRKNIEKKFKDGAFKEGTKKQSKKKKQKHLKKKPISKDDIYRYGPYFNYLPFERAVIESKGVTPFNNYHVEMIANKGYDQDHLGYWSPSTLIKEPTLKQQKTIDNKIKSLGASTISFNNPPQTTVREENQFDQKLAQIEKDSVPQMERIEEFKE